MARGTGIPYQDDDARMQPTPGLSGDAVSNAAAWGQIAQAGRRLTDASADIVQRETHRSQIGYLAGAETDITRKRIELRDQFARDPAGFDRAWTAYRDGVLGNAEPWAVGHLRKRLGVEGNEAYGSLLSERRALDQRLDTDRINTLLGQAGDEVIGSAMSGGLGSDRGKAALARLQGILDSAVTSELMTPEAAQTRLQNITSRAAAEAVVKTIGDTYRSNRAAGFEAGPSALREAERLLLRTEDERLSGLTEQERHAYFSRATSEVRALEAERRQDLTLALQATRELQTAMAAGIRPNPDTVDSLVEQLEAAGGHADAARLRAAVVRQPRLEAFGRLPLGEQVNRYADIARDAGAGFAPDVNRAIEDAARESGLNPSLLRRYARIESGGRPDAATGSYRGLFQLSEAEFARYGGGDINNPADNARAAGRMLADRAQAFRSKYGREPTPTDLYLIHQQGEGGYAAHVGNPTGLAWQNMAGTAEGRTRGETWAKAAIWGNIPDSDKRRFPGGVDSVTSADFIEIWRRRVGGGAEAGVDLPMVVGARGAIESSARAEWKRLDAEMTAVRNVTPAELQAVIGAAGLLGDDDLLEEIGARRSRFLEAQEAGRLPLDTQQRVVGDLQAAPSLPPGANALVTDLQRIAKATRDGLNNDPIALGAQRFPERIAQPPPFNLADQNAARTGLRARAAIAGFVGEAFGDPSITVLGAGDRTQIAGAIAGGNAQEAANAFDVLASVPDQFLRPTLSNKEIKDAITGAVNSNDPARFTAAMQGLDRLWQRAPQEFNGIFGEDVVRTLQDWQGALRYHTSEELAEQLRRREDPQARDRRRLMEEAGRREANKVTIDKLVDAMDPGWFSTGPSAPIDDRTANAALGDYTRLHAERYAATGNHSTAHSQAVERMRLYWSRSEVNGGRLTMHAPETVYQPINGSHDWMRQDLLRDLNAMEIDPLTGREWDTAAQPFDMPPSRPVPEFSLHADRRTEADIANGRPASYLVMMRRSDGTVDMVRSPDGTPRRYFWDRGTPQAGSREEFQRQRQRVLQAPEWTYSGGASIPMGAP